MEKTQVGVCYESYVNEWIMYALRTWKRKFIDLYGAAPESPKINTCSARASYGKGGEVVKFVDWWDTTDKKIMCSIITKYYV